MDMIKYCIKVDHAIVGISSVKRAIIQKVVLYVSRFFTDVTCHYYTVLSVAKWRLAYWGLNSPGVFKLFIEVTPHNCVLYREAVA